jgi:hypothetical protein
MQSALAITYQQPAPDNLDLLLIEQEEWGKNVGVVTTAEMLRYISAWVYNQLYRASTDCGMVDGRLTCTINVYPRVPGLPYQLRTSWGSISGPRGGMTTFEEILNFTLTTEERVQYPCREILGVDWLAECYDASGAVVTPPALAIDGDTIVIPAPVYGSVQVRYRTERYSHTLSVPRREDALEEFFSAAAYALYDGGLTWIDVDLPNSFDEATATERCGLSGSGSVSWPEDDPRPIADNPYRRKTVVDYCSQTIISDTIT